MISNNVVSNSSDFKLINCPDNFVGGKTSLFYDKWRTITTDVNILKIIKNGCTLKFNSEPVSYDIFDPGSIFIHGILNPLIET